MSRIRKIGALLACFSALLLSAGATGAATVDDAKKEGPYA
jgi:hypothetical protein